MTLAADRHTDRPAAGAQLQATLHRLFTQPREHLSEPLGQLGGFDLHATIDRRVSDEVTIAFNGAPVTVTYARADLRDLDPVATIGRLERKLRSLDHLRDQARDDATAARHEAQQAQARLGTPFEHGDRLTTLTTRQAQIAAELTPPEPAPDLTPLAAHIAPGPDLAL